MSARRSKSLRVLFVMQHPGCVRNYESVIRQLASSGHSVRLAFNDPHKESGDRLAEALTEEFEDVTWGLAPAPTGMWRGLARIIRFTVDYARYSDPAFANTPLLTARAGSYLPRPLRAIVDTVTRAGGASAVATLKHALLRIARALPADPTVKKFLIEEDPDVVLVTPVVLFGSDQVEFVKAADYSGIPVGICVMSWDNLTNKGLLRYQPHRVFVWNDVQKAEAIALHDIDESVVEVTGAQCYDKWFEGAPSADSESFARRVGLRSDDNFILYLASSKFIAPYCVGFVKRWLTALRASGSAELRSMPVVIRPHPQNASQWDGVDLSEFGDVCVFPRGGANPVNSGAKNDFFDSIYHSRAVVGLNTSAMIEAGILGKPVLTVLDEEFKATQEGTAHFHHLLDGGLLDVATSLDEHVAQLERVLDSDPNAERRARFVESFVRPHGLTRSGTECLVAAVLDLAKSHPKPRSASYTDMAIRLLAFAPAAFVYLAWIVSKQARKRAKEA